MDLNQQLNAVYESLRQLSAGENFVNANAILTNFLSQSSQCPSAIPLAQRILADPTSNDQSRYYALQIYHVVVASSGSSSNQSVNNEQLHSAVCSLLNVSRGVVSEARFIKEKIADVVADACKRQWPQLWPNMIQEIMQIGVQGNRQSELVCLSLRTIALDSSSAEFSSNLAPRRRRELIQGLTVAFPQVFPSFKQLLEKCIFEGTGSNLTDALDSESSPSPTSSLIIASSILELFASFASFIPLNMVRESSLLPILAVCWSRCALLPVSSGAVRIRLQSAIIACLESISSRRLEGEADSDIPLQIVEVVVSILQGTRSLAFPLSNYMDDLQSIRCGLSSGPVGPTGGALGSVESSSMVETDLATFRSLCSVFCSIGYKYLLTVNKLLSNALQSASTQQSPSLHPSSSTVNHDIQAEAYGKLIRQYLSVLNELLQHPSLLIQADTLECVMLLLSPSNFGSFHPRLAFEFVSSVILPLILCLVDEDRFCNPLGYEVLSKTAKRALNHLVATFSGQNTHFQVGTWNRSTLDSRDSEIVRGEIFDLNGAPMQPAVAHRTLQMSCIRSEEFQSDDKRAQHYVFTLRKSRAERALVLLSQHCPALVVGELASFAGAVRAIVDIGRSDAQNLHNSAGIALACLDPLLFVRLLAPSDSLSLSGMPSSLTMKQLPVSWLELQPQRSSVATQLQQQQIQSLLRARCVRLPERLRYAVTPYSGSSPLAALPQLLGALGRVLELISLSVSSALHCPVEEKIQSLFEAISSNSSSVVSGGFLNLQSSVCLTLSSIASTSGTSSNSGNSGSNTGELSLVQPLMSARSPASCAAIMSSLSSLAEITLALLPNIASSTQTGTLKKRDLIVESATFQLVASWTPLLSHQPSLISPILESIFWTLEEKDLVDTVGISNSNSSNELFLLVRDTQLSRQSACRLLVALARDLPSLLIPIIGPLSARAGAIASRLSPQDSISLVEALVLVSHGFGTSENGRANAREFLHGIISGFVERLGHISTAIKGPEGLKQFVKGAFQAGFGITSLSSQTLKGARITTFPKSPLLLDCLRTNGSVTNPRGVLVQLPEDAFTSVAPASFVTAGVKAMFTQIEGALACLQVFWSAMRRSSAGETLRAQYSSQSQASSSSSRSNTINGPNGIEVSHGSVPVPGVKVLGEYCSSQAALVAPLGGLGADMDAILRAFRENGSHGGPLFSFLAPVVAAAAEALLSVLRCYGPTHLQQSLLLDVPLSNLDSLGLDSGVTFTACRYLLDFSKFLCFLSVEEELMLQLGVHGADSDDKDAEEDEFGAIESILEVQVPIVTGLLSGVKEALMSSNTSSMGGMLEANISQAVAHGMSCVASFSTRLIWCTCSIVSSAISGHLLAAKGASALSLRPLPLPSTGNVAGGNSSNVVGVDSDGFQVVQVPPPLPAIPLCSRPTAAQCAEPAVSVAFSNAHSLIALPGSATSQQPASIVDLKEEWVYPLFFSLQTTREGLFAPAGSPSSPHSEALRRLLGEMLSKEVVEPLPMRLKKNIIQLLLPSILDSCPPLPSAGRAVAPLLLPLVQSAWATIKVSSAHRARIFNSKLLDSGLTQNSPSSSVDLGVNSAAATAALQRGLLPPLHALSPSEAQVSQAVELLDGEKFCRPPDAFLSAFLPVAVAAAELPAGMEGVRGSAANEPYAPPQPGFKVVERLPENLDALREKINFDSHKVLLDLFGHILPQPEMWFCIVDSSSASASVTAASSSASSGSSQSKDVRQPLKYAFFQNSYDSEARRAWDAPVLAMELLLRPVNTSSEGLRDIFSDMLINCTSVGDTISLKKALLLMKPLCTFVLRSVQALQTHSEHVAQVRWANGSVPSEIDSSSTQKMKIYYNLPNSLPPGDIAEMEMLATDMKYWIVVLERIFVNLTNSLLFRLPVVTSAERDVISVLVDILCITSISASSEGSALFSLLVPTPGSREDISTGFYASMNSKGALPAGGIPPPDAIMSTLKGTRYQNKRSVSQVPTEYLASVLNNPNNSASKATDKFGNTNLFDTTMYSFFVAKSERERRTTLQDALSAVSAEAFRIGSEIVASSTVGVNMTGASQARVAVVDVKERLLLAGRGIQAQGSSTIINSDPLQEEVGLNKMFGDNDDF